MNFFLKKDLTQGKNLAWTMPGPSFPSYGCWLRKWWKFAYPELLFGAYENCCIYCNINFFLSFQCGENILINVHVTTEEDYGAYIVFLFSQMRLDVREDMKWAKVFKNGPSKICGRQPLKNLKGYWTNEIHLYHDTHQKPA